MASNVPVTLDTLITVKILFQDNNKRFKIPLRDLGAQVLPDKLRALLDVDPNEEVVFERYSDSAGAYVTLDANKPQVYKTLFRAAKAKLKLRLKATLASEGNEVNDNLQPLVPAEQLVPAPSAPAFPYSTPNTQAHMGISPLIARSSMQSFDSTGYRKPTVEDEEPQGSPVSPVAENKADNDGEAPVPRPFQTRERFFNGLANAARAELAIRPKEVAAPSSSWAVYCNNCNQSMEDEHYHCSVCDNGDYDLCDTCVKKGIHCFGSDHWLVKRFVKNGCVVNSTTERIMMKSKSTEVEKEMPGAFTDEKQSLTYEPEEPTRTCNCCVKVLPEKEFVTCTNCEDYDLCLDCHTSNKHGHHPGHVFQGATPQTALSALADFLCNAGRNVRHSAVCDGCEKFIYGVRHKCLNCPDWDFCSECIKDAKFIHPRHRFVPIYEPLAEPNTCAVRHYGIYCDGPLCKDKENVSYIEGVRYKCAVCNDTDFCANCEATPINRHNRTHPLIKFKTPVRSVSVTTMNEDRNGDGEIRRLGDQPTRKSTATETTPVAPSTNAATQVQTIVDMKPSEEPQYKPSKEKIEIKDLLTEPVHEKIKVQDLLSSPPQLLKQSPEQGKTEPLPISKADSPQPTGELDAHFIRDTITDGTKVFSGLTFVQVWTLRNPGPVAWPAGCSVRHVGGDNMLNLDNTQPLSHSELAEASESNVVGRSVEPGEEISFRIVMKAPKREGTAISYWRLKTADGTPFGHRLWCDIQVVNPPTPVVAPIVPQPTTTAERSETSQPSSSSATMAAFQRFQQAKKERFVTLQKERLNMMQKEHKERALQEAERKTKIQEEAFERLKRMRLQLDKRVAESESRSSHALKAERERLLRIQEVRRAAVERMLETRRREQEAAAAATSPKFVAPQATAVYAAAQTAELPVEEKPVQAEATHEPQPQSSGMIFPQLEKESPASSTHELNAKAESTTSKSEAITETATIQASSEHSDEEFFEDAESVEIRSISSDDDGFMTDEEYDILDASDEEIP